MLNNAFFDNKNFIRNIYFLVYKFKIFLIIKWTQNYSYKNIQIYEVLL